MENLKENINFETASLKGEKIMLLGGAGFIGHHLALALRKKEAEVLVIEYIKLIIAIPNPMPPIKPDTPIFR